MSLPKQLLSSILQLNKVSKVYKCLCPTFNIVFYKFMIKSVLCEPYSDNEEPSAPVILGPSKLGGVVGFSGAPKPIKVCNVGHTVTSAPYFDVFL